MGIYRYASSFTTKFLCVCCVNYLLLLMRLLILNDTFQADKIELLFLNNYSMSL